MYKSFERLKYESESLVSLSATQPKYWRFSVYSMSGLILLAVWACNWMNIWLWLLNNEGSLQGAGQGNRCNLNVIKSAKQKEAYQWWERMWPLQKGMASQIIPSQMAARTVCLATHLALKRICFLCWTGLKQADHVWWRCSCAQGKLRGLETSQPRRITLVNLWTQALKLHQCLFLHFIHVFEHGVHLMLSLFQYKTGVCFPL